MYPSGQLERLAVRKALLQARIAVRRQECLAAGAELGKPLALVDRGIALWKRVSPMVKVLGLPAGMLLWRVIQRRAGGWGHVLGRNKVGSLLALAPMILRGVRMFQGMRTTKPQTSGAD